MYLKRNQLNIIAVHYRQYSLYNNICTQHQECAITQTNCCASTESKTGPSSLTI